MRRRQDGRTRRSWHLWVVAVAAFALYIGGARDFVLILLQDSDYIRGQFGAGGIAYFTDYPVMLRIVWGINILGGLIAPMLLLARWRAAFPVALTATVAQVVLLAVTFSLFDRWSLLGATIAWFDIGVGALTALFTAYCWAARPR